MICLDTNAIIATINLRPRAVRSQLQQSLTEGVAVGITAIALFEMWYGIQKSPRPPENAAALGLFLTLDVTPWPFEPSDAEEAGDIRAALERAGTRIGPTMSSSPPRRAAAAPSW